jgi:hypothetical protein
LIEVGLELVVAGACHGDAFRHKKTPATKKETPTPGGGR